MLRCCSRKMLTKLTPSFIGLSGRGTYASSPPRGQAADSDSMAWRGVMMVRPFATSETISEHPKALTPMARTACTRWRAFLPSPMARRSGQCGLIEPFDHMP